MILKETEVKRVFSWILQHTKRMNVKDDIGFYTNFCGVVVRFLDNFELFLNYFGRPKMIFYCDVLRFL